MRTHLRMLSDQSISGKIEWISFHARAERNALVVRVSRKADVSLFFGSLGLGPLTLGLTPPLRSLPLEAYR